MPIPGRSSLIRLFMPLLLLFRDALQLRAAPLDGLEKAGQVLFEVREHLVGVVLRPQAYLALPAASLFHDLRAPLLGPFKDLFFRGDLLGLLLRAPDDAVALAARLVEHSLSLLDDPAGLLEFLWDGLAHL